MYDILIKILDFLLLFLNFSNISTATFLLLIFYFSLTFPVVELVGGGPVINGAGNR